MHTYKRIIAALLCLSAALPLGACRHSSTVEEIIYDQYKNGEFDFTPPFTLEDDVPEAEDESEELPDIEEEDEAERLGDETPEQAIDEPEETPPPEEPELPSAEATYLETGSYDLPAPAPAEQEVAGPEGESGEAGGDGTDKNGEGEGGAGDEGTGIEADSRADTFKQVVDAYGREVQIPEDVGNIAAVGELALMVLMLSGAETLAATDAALASEEAALRAFDGLENVPALWSGDGEHTLPDAEFEALCVLHPDVVLETSGSATFTNAQVERLSSEGIAYLVLPQPTGRQAVATVMTALGTVLGDQSAEGGKNAPQIAADYIAWQNGVYGAVSAATSGFAQTAADDEDEESVAVTATYTLFVDGWDDGASYRLYNETYTTMSGDGCAYVSNAATRACRAVSNALGDANIVNTGSFYGISPKVQYFTPLISDYRTMSVTGTKADGMVTDGQKLLEQGGESLGTAGFRYLIAADRHTAEAIENSELWAVYPRINSGDGSFNGDGFLDEEGNLVRTQISGEYEVLVNPAGLSDWTRGGAEGVLESAWAAWRFFGTVGEAQVRDWIEELYSRFYGLDLSAAEIDAILEGK